MCELFKPPEQVGDTQTSYSSELSSGLVSAGAEETASVAAMVENRHEVEGPLDSVVEGTISRQ